MNYLINALIILAAFVSMEGIAWALHKYVMHGFLWSIHEDHHIRRDKLFEKNDFFAVIFGIPSWLFIMFGIMGGNDYRLYIGIGITLYGICYVLIHDGLIHNRIKVFSNTKNIYLLGLRKGHLAHHIHDKDSDYDKDKDVCYGMLWVPLSYFKKAKKELKDSPES